MHVFLAIQRSLLKVISIHDKVRKDSNGDVKRSSTTFAYDRSKDDLKSIASLLNVLGGDAALNRFLQNIQVFSKGHFQRYPLSNVDIRA